MDEAEKIREQVRARSEQPFVNVNRQVVVQAEKTPKDIKEQMNRYVLAKKGIDQMRKDIRQPLVYGEADEVEVNPRIMLPDISVRQMQAIRQGKDAVIASQQKTASKVQSNWNAWREQNQTCQGGFDRKKQAFAEHMAAWKKKRKA